jgi:hypothetical protein
MSVAGELSHWQGKIAEVSMSWETPRTRLVNYECYNHLQMQTLFGMTSRALCKDAK